MTSEKVSVKVLLNEGTGNSVCAEKIDVIGHQNIHNTFVTQTSSGSELPRLFNSHLQVFVGRNKEIKILKDLFVKSKISCVLISAIGGQGKTVLAKKFIQEITKGNDSLPPAVNWLNGETIQTLVNDMNDYMKEIGLGNNVGDTNNQSISTKCMIDFLSRSAHQPNKHGWIVVLDNVDKKYPEFEDIVDKFVQCGSFLIITSREVDITFKEAEHIPLRGLEPDAATLLVKQLLPNEVNESDILELCKELDNYPLGIRQAIAYITFKQRKFKYAVKTFLDDLRIAGAKLLSENKLRDYSLSTLNIMEMTLEKIQNEENGAEALMLLKLLSLVTADGVTKTYLEGLVAKCYKMKNMELPLILLEGISFVEVSNSEDPSVSIHRIVQTIVRDKMKADNEIEQLLDKLLDCHEYSLVRSNISSLDRNQIQNLILIWEHSFEYSNLVKGHKEMATDIFNRLLSLTLYRELHRFTRGIANALRNISGEESQDTLWMEYCACLGLETSGEYEEALKLYREIWKKQVKVVGQYHSQTLLTQEQIAETLCRMKRYEESLFKHQEVYSLMLKYHPKDHSYTRITQHNIAICLKEMGNLERALPIFKEVYQFRNKTFGATFSWTLDTRNHIADIWFQKMYFEKARLEYEDVYFVSKSKEGELHENTMKALEMSAKCLWEIGRKQEGYEKLSESVKLYGKAMGLGHPNTLMCQEFLREWNDQYQQIIQRNQEIVDDIVGDSGSDDEKKIQSNQIQSTIKKSYQDIDDQNNQIYFNKFQEINKIGEGDFGSVWKVKEKSNQIHYAIKIIETKGDFDLKEMKILSKLNKDFIYQYFDSWTEIGVVGIEIKPFLYIQMELCEQNLREFLKLMPNNKRFQTSNYYISCELLKELIECVDYLHSLNPQIIHRNLKPENILISDGSNGRVLKLSDFGTEKFHDNCIHTRMVATLNYMAPEVFNSGTYTTKSDIYSLALIGTEIFGFGDKIEIIRDHKTREEFDIYLTKYSCTIINEKFANLLDLISSCLLQEDYQLRPNCKQLLRKIQDISIDKSLVLNENISFFNLFSGKPENSLLKRIFEIKNKTFKK